MRRVLAVLVAVSLAFLSAAAVTPAAAEENGRAPLTVSPSSPLLRYEGRWDIGERKATTVNSGSRMFLRFHGDEVTARFDIEEIEYPPHIYAYVDGCEK